MKYLKDKIEDAIAKDKKEFRIIFYHGIGDCMMFIPLLWEIYKRWGDKINISCFLPKGQERLYKILNICHYTNFIDDSTIIETNEISSFEVEFPLQDPKKTKFETCLDYEIGIPLGEISFDKFYINKGIFKSNSKIVGFHFQNTCFPDLANPPEEKAEKLWKWTKEVGFIPLEIHFLHPFANPINQKFSFVDFTTRTMECDIRNLIMSIASCRKFVGVNSGPYFVASYARGNENVMFLERDCPLYTVVESFELKNRNLMNTYYSWSEKKFKNFLRGK